MTWSLLITVVVLGIIVAISLQHRRQRRLIPTQHALRCPVNDCAASLTVDTDPVAYPSRRHADVRACSLLQSTAFVPPPRKGYLSDMPSEYLDDVGQAPRHSAAVACSKPCLFVLNAVEAGGRPEPLRCTSGVSDALDLAQQVQSPAITRITWFHSA